MNETLNELTNERFSEIDSLMNNSELNDIENITFNQLLINYIESIEAIQARFEHHNIDCSELRQYLFSIMLNDC